MNEEEERVFAKVKNTLNRAEKECTDKNGSETLPDDCPEDVALRPIALKLLEWAANVTAMAYGLGDLVAPMLPSGRHRHR